MINETKEKHPFGWCERERNRVQGINELSYTRRLGLVIVTLRLGWDTTTTQHKLQVLCIRNMGKRHVFCHPPNSLTGCMPWAFLETKPGAFTWHTYTRTSLFSLHHFCCTRPNFIYIYIQKFLLSITLLTKVFFKI